MEYNSNDNTWMIVKKFRSCGAHLSVNVSYKGDILACGTHKKKNKILRYDPDSDVWVRTDIDISDIKDPLYFFIAYI